MLAKAFDVKLDGLLNELHRFVAAFTDSYAARKVRNVRTKRCFALLDDDDVFTHLHITSIASHHVFVAHFAW